MSTFVLKTIVEDMAIDVGQEIPAIAMSTQEFANSYVDDGGDTIQIRLQDYGEDLVSGFDITGVTGGVTQAKVDLQLLPFSQAVKTSAIEAQFKMGNSADMIMKPRHSRMASNIHTNHLNKMFKNLGSVEVVNSGTGDYKDVRKAVANVELSRIKAPTFGIFGVQLASEIKSSGLGYFQGSGLAESFKTGALVNMDGTELMRSSDIGNLTTGTHALGAGTEMKLKTAITVEGTTTMVFKVVGGTATLAGTIKAGEPILGVDINGADAYRGSTGKQYSFIAQADATATAGNELTVTVQPIYMAETPLKNVSVSSIPADTVFSFGLTASSVYKRGVIWTKPAVCYCSHKITKPEGWPSEEISTYSGINILATKGSNFETIVNATAFRVLYGSAVTYTSGVSGYFVKV